LTIWSVLFFWLKTAYTSFPFIQSPQAFQRFHPTFVRQSAFLIISITENWTTQNIRA
jgi:hypothetical protein